MSARRMLDALISVTHDPDVLADLAKGTLRKKIPALRDPLHGRFTGHHALLIGQMLAQVDSLDEMIQTLSAQIEEVSGPYARELELLDTIPGIERRTAELLLSEIGPDMSRFPTDAHLASWGGICPGKAMSEWVIARSRQLGWRSCKRAAFGVRAPPARANRAPIGCLAV